MAAEFTIMHRDDFEKAGPKWSARAPVARPDGVRDEHRRSATWREDPRAHETDRDQEEVFVTLAGSPTVVIGGVEHPAPEGTYVRLDPEPMRTVLNNGSEPASVLIISAPRSSGYEPMDWA